MLDITASELADEAGVSLRTLQRFEASQAVPDAQARLLERLKYTLEQRGVAFLGDPQSAPGVQLDIKQARSAKGRAKR